MIPQGYRDPGQLVPSTTYGPPKLAVHARRTPSPTRAEGPVSVQDLLSEISSPPPRTQHTENPSKSHLGETNPLDPNSIEYQKMTKVFAVPRITPPIKRPKSKLKPVVPQPPPPPKRKHEDSATIQKFMIENRKRRQRLEKEAEAKRIEESNKIKNRLSNLAQYRKDRLKLIKPKMEVAPEPVDCQSRSSVIMAVPPRLILESEDDEDSSQIMLAEDHRETSRDVKIVAIEVGHVAPTSVQRVSVVAPVDIPSIPIATEPVASERRPETPRKEETVSDITSDLCSSVKKIGSQIKKTEMDPTMTKFAFLQKLVEQAQILHERVESRVKHVLEDSTTSLDDFTTFDTSMMPDSIIEPSHQSVIRGVKPIEPSWIQPTADDSLLANSAQWNSSRIEPQSMVLDDPSNLEFKDEFELKKTIESPPFNQAAQLNTDAHDHVQDEVPSISELLNEVIVQPVQKQESITHFSISDMSLSSLEPSSEDVNIGIGSLQAYTERIQNLDQLDTSAKLVHVPEPVRVIEKEEKEAICGRLARVLFADAIKPAQALEQQDLDSNLSGPEASINTPANQEASRQARKRQVTDESLNYRVVPKELKMKSNNDQLKVMDIFQRKFMAKRQFPPRQTETEPILMETPAEIAVNPVIVAPLIADATLAQEKLSDQVAHQETEIQFDSFSSEDMDADISSLADPNPPKSKPKKKYDAHAPARSSNSDSANSSFSDKPSIGKS